MTSVPVPVWKRAGEFARRNVCKNQPGHFPTCPEEQDAINMMRNKLVAFWREVALIYPTPVIEPDVVYPYTVLLLVPSDYWDGHQSDWIYRAWVIAKNPLEAITTAMKQAIGDGDRQPDEFATLVVFEGHHRDMFTGQG